MDVATTTSRSRPPTTDDARLADRRSRAVGAAAVIALAVALAIWLAAEGLRAADFPERTTKGWLSFLAGAAALVQLVSMVAANRSRDPLRRLRIVRLHRVSGSVALLAGGFVTYLCFTFAYPPGVTLHRATGFVLCLVVMAKFGLIRARGDLVGAIAVLGVLLVIGFQIEFATQGLQAIRGAT